MRERERLEDFKGGHVACRGCKRLIYFDPDALQRNHAPVICCGIAYVPTQYQIDLFIYDKLQPGDIENPVELPTTGPVLVESLEEVPSEEGMVLLEADDEPYESSLTAEAELDTIVATPAQVAERRAERVAALKKRGRIDYG